MNILAIDTCLKLTGTALFVDGRTFGPFQYDLGRQQSSGLSKMCESLIKSAGLNWNELDYIAMTNGPGYFTGIRVGASYSSALAYASGAKIIPVSTLELLPSKFTGKVLTVIYAGHGFVYASCKGFLEPGEYSHDQIRYWLMKNPDAVIISDDPERTGLSVEIIKVRPEVSKLIEIATPEKAVSPRNLQICYLKLPQGVI